MMNVNTALSYLGFTSWHGGNLFDFFLSKSFKRMLNISTEDIFPKLPLIFLMVDTKSDTNKITVQSRKIVRTAPPAD